MDRRKFNGGGSRKGAGRKKGSSVSNIIANTVRDRVDEILKDILKSKDVSTYAVDSYLEHSLFIGWIYLIKNKDTGLYKIGITQKKNINQRITQYKSHEMNVNVIFADRVNYVNELEDMIHSAIENFVKGDWFECDLNILCKILKIITEHKHNGRTQE